MNRFFAAFGLAIAFGLGGTSATACTDPGGIGGTGIMGEGGIGGTGQRAEADVGVVGVITGFGSICVNGLEVHYDAATPVSVNGEPASSDALAIGKVVAVRAVGKGNQARARTIDIVDSAVGLVNAVETAGTLIQVYGQRVRVDPSTVIAGNIQLGETLRVSGLRAADGSIVATRIEAAPPSARPLAGDAADPGLERFVVQGFVAEVQPKALRVGADTFSVTPELQSQLARDRLVRLSGRTEGGNRIVERAEFLRGPFDVRPERSLRVETRPSRPEGRSGRSGPDRVERPDRSGPGSGDRPERIDRSGSNSGRR